MRISFLFIWNHSFHTGVCAHKFNLVHFYINGIIFYIQLFHRPPPLHPPHNEVSYLSSHKRQGCHINLQMVLTTRRPVQLLCPLPLHSIPLQRHFIKSPFWNMSMCLTVFVTMKLIGNSQAHICTFIEAFLS